MLRAVSAPPSLAADVPPPTALDGSMGVSPRAAREDHTHAARVQRTVVTTTSDGTATWTFARPIVCATGKLPPVTFMVEDTGTPVVVQITARALTSTADQDTHTAVTIRAQRARTLPAVFTALFDVFGASAAGVKVNLFAADPTQ